MTPGEIEAFNDSLRDYAAGIIRVALRLADHVNDGDYDKAYIASSLLSTQGYTLSNAAKQMAMITLANAPDINNPLELE